MYPGCTIKPESNVFKIKGVYTTADFIGVPKKEDDSTPKYNSTIFWSPGTIVNENGGPTISFFTGDITGTFSIIVQGIGVKGFVFATQEFSVQ
jgi:hypothetical protein